MNYWNQNLRDGLKAEQMLYEALSKYFKVRPISYQSSKTIQQDGVDGFILADKEWLSYDVKVRDFGSLKYNDILFEHVSIIEENKPGWFWKKADLLFYMWWNEQQTAFEKGYTIDLKMAQSKLSDQLTQYPKKIATTNDGKWHTESYAIPIYDLINSNILIELEHIFYNQKI